MLSSSQLRELTAAGMSIGAHTVTHPILATLSSEEARREIAQGRDALESIIGRRVAHFAYPNGRPESDYDDDSVDIVRELGFDSAVSTAWGAARSSTDRFQLPRFSPWDTTRGRFGLRMAGNLWTS
jgi:peptidoglycan/xylan/chitin deacetylase (PgdA/CDA1 family)